MFEFVVLGIMCGILFGTISTLFIYDETAKAAGVEF